MIKWFVFVMFLATPAYANDIESERLARIKREIALLVDLVRESESLSDAESDVVFRYDVLIARLERLRTDIQSHIDYTGTLPQPKTFVVR